MGSFHKKNRPIVDITLQKVYTYIPVFDRQNNQNLSMSETLASEPLFIPGYHGHPDEVAFVENVIRDEIRGNGFLGQISLIGSRCEGSWISSKEFSRTYGRPLSPKVRQQWMNFLNEQAKKNRYTRKELPLLVDDLPDDAPEPIIAFLEDDPGSDFDLLLIADTRPPGIERIYLDDPTGQCVDIWVSGEPEDDSDA